MTIKFLPFSQLRADDPSFGQGVREAKNLLPVFGSLRPLRKFERWSRATSQASAINGSFAYLFQSTAGEQRSALLTDTFNSNTTAIPVPSTRVSSVTDADRAEEDRIAAIGTRDASDNEFVGFGAPYTDSNWKLKNLAAPGVAGGVFIKARYRVPSLEGSFYSVTLNLYQGSPDDGGSLVTTQTIMGVSAVDDWVDYEYNLSGPEEALITDWEGLHLHFGALFSGSDDQLAAPTGTEEVAGWRGNDAGLDLHGYIDEGFVSSDSDYIVTPALEAGQSSDKAVLTLEDVAPVWVDGDTRPVLAVRTNSPEDVAVQFELMVDREVVKTVSFTTTAGEAGAWQNRSLDMSSLLLDDLSDKTLSVGITANNENASATGDVQARPTASSSPTGHTWLSQPTTSDPRWQMVDEAVVNDADYLLSQWGDSQNDFDISSPAVEPAFNDNKILARVSGAFGHTFSVAIVTGGSQVWQETKTLTSGAAFVTYEFDVPESISAAIDWTDVQIRLIRGADPNPDVSPQKCSWLYYEGPSPVVAKISNLYLEERSQDRVEVSWLQLQANSASTYYEADTVRWFAGNNTTLYEVEPDAWVSKGSFTAAGIESLSWDFAQWGEDLLATNYSTPLLKWTPSTGTFATFITTPATNTPQGAFVAAASDQVFLGNINAAASPGHYEDEVWWSGIDDAASFSNPVTDPSILSDYQRLRATPGAITGLLGGRDVTIFKHNSVYRGRFVGGAAIWTFEVISDGVGTIHPRSIVQVGPDIYFWHGSGFAVLRGGQQVEYLGEGNIGRFISDEEFGEFSIQQPGVADQRVNHAQMVGAYDSYSKLIFWSYRGRGDGENQNNHVIIYNTGDGSWGHVEDTIGIADIMTNPRVLTGSKSLTRGLGVITYDSVGGTSDFGEFGAEDSYPATIKTATSSFEDGVNYKVTRVRPIYRYQEHPDIVPDYDRTPRATVTIEASEDPHLQTQLQTRVTEPEKTADGWYTVSPPIQGEYFRFTLNIPSLGSQTIRDVIGLQVDLSDPQGNQ